MALGTFGSNSTSTLQAMIMSPAANMANVALMAAAIKDDLNPAHPTWPGAWQRDGFLFVPNRGILKLLPGDYVAVTTTGFPIALSAAAVAADFTYTP